MLNTQFLKPIAIFVLLCILNFDIHAKSVYILNFNDFHAMLCRTGEIPGMVLFMNAILSEIRKYGKENVVVVSGGDNYQGSFISFITHGRPVNEMFKELGVAFSAVGNHEFDWGQQFFPNWQRDGDFLFLAANVVDEKSKKVPKCFTPYKIIKRNGIKLAFIGLTTVEAAMVTDAKNVKGLKIVEPWVSAQYWVNYLKAGKDAEGTPDVIIALTHIPAMQDKNTGEIKGEEINNLCSKTIGLDIVISGHSHKTVCGKNRNGILVIQAEESGMKYGIIQIDINDGICQKREIKAKICSVPKSGDILFENSGDKILKKYEEMYNTYSKVIGKSTTALPYDSTTINTLGNYVAKVMAEATNSNIALINGIGIRGGLEKGDITVADIFRISPFNDSLVRMKLSGKTIKNMMEYGLNNYKKYRKGCLQFYGMKIVFDHSRTIGEKIVYMTLNDGRKIELNKYYLVCMPEFLFYGGDGYKANGAVDVKIYNGLLVRDILIKDIEVNQNLDLHNFECFIDTAESQLKDAV